MNSISHMQWSLSDHPEITEEASGTHQPKHQSIFKSGACKHDYHDRMMHQMKSANSSTGYLTWRCTSRVIVNLCHTLPCSARTSTVMQHNTYELRFQRRLYIDYNCRFHNSLERKKGLKVEFNLHWKFTKKVHRTGYKTGILHRVEWNNQLLAISFTRNSQQLELRQLNQVWYMCEWRR